MDECGLLRVRPVDFLMEALAQGKVLANPTRYRQLISRLIYLTITPPDLTFAAHVLSQ